jgi:hypothetical protein
MGNDFQGKNNAYELTVDRKTFLLMRGSTVIIGYLSKAFGQELLLLYRGVGINHFLPVRLPPCVLPFGRLLRTG